MRICLDLDGTICETRRPEQSYDDVAPLPGAIEKIQSIKAAGHTIIISTARGMGAYNNNIGAINFNNIPVIAKWLEKHQIPCDEIWNKPLADCYLDDKAIKFEGWDKVNI